MKRFLALTVLGLASLTVTAQQASAHWLLDHFHHCHCCLNVCAKQYNAFSPYCIDSVHGCCPGPVVGAWGNGGGPGYTDGGECAPGELPPPGTPDGHPVAPPPAARAPVAGAPFIISGNGPMMMPGPGNGMRIVPSASPQR
jgi:hypothetical protein